MDEIWKDIPGYEGLYKVSNTGIVRSESRVVTMRNGVKRIQIGKELSLCLRGGYLFCVLYKNKLRYNNPLHRILAKTFIANPSGKSQVNHINGIKTDNNIYNLEWSTACENIQHSWKTGLHKVTPGLRESARKNGLKMAKPVLMYTKEGIFVKRFDSATQARIETGCHPPDTLDGRRKQSKGFIFKYEYHE